MRSARIGVAIGSTSVAFSTLCLLVTPAFTPALVLAILFGSLSGAISLALKAKRMAIVVFVFALTPLLGLLLLEYVAERVRSGYVAFAA